MLRWPNRLAGSPEHPPSIRLRALTTAEIFWGLLFGSVGLGFFTYGKKQKAVVPLVCGLALMVLPYLVSNVVWLVAAGVALAVAPYFVKI